MLVETVDDITNTMLEVRRYEKNFLLYKDVESQKELKGHLAILRQYIDNIKVEIVKIIGNTDYLMIKAALTEYEQLFDRTAETLKLQEDLSVMLRSAGVKIESRLKGAELETFLTLRKYEKNLMMSENAESYRLFTDLYNNSFFDKNRKLDNYHMLIRKLFELYEHKNSSTEGMRKKAREIQSFTEDLSKRERADIDRRQKRSMKLLLFAMASMIALGIIISIRVGTSIAKPLRRLEKVTKKIAQGDFSEVIEVKGKDEIASLETSVNQMEEKLLYAMTSLELTVEKLQEKQAQLVEAEKLASIGKLAAGVAHEINNPLTAVLTFSSLMLEQMPADDPRRERLRMIVQETNRARNIVRQVLSFAKEAPLKTVKINVNQPVTEIVDALMAQEAFKDIELIMDLSDDLPEIYIDPVQIGQVVLNILLNATHAITPPGKIHVSSRVADKFIELVISDTGKGISQEHLKKIFDPFFTTKDKSKGTGLGLAVSYGIIKKHGGDIEVSSTVNKGTTFIVRLPLNG